MFTFARQVEISNPSGLHLRAAHRFVEVAQRFRADIRVYCRDQHGDGKSVLDLLCLAAGCGTRLVLEARGPDAEEALAALDELLVAGFHETADG